MDKEKILTKTQWAAVAAMTWLAPIACLSEANSSLGVDKFWVLAPALVLALGLGLLLLWLASASSLFSRLRDAASFGAQLLRWLLALYLLLVAGRFLSTISSMWLAWAGAETPRWVFLLLLLAIAAYGLHRGSSAILRWAVLEMLALPVLAILDTLLLLPKMRWERLNFMPSWEPAWGEGLFVYLALLAATLPVLLWYGALPKSQNRKAALWGWLLSGLYLLLLLIRDALVQGALSTWERFPLLRTLKMVELGVGLNRMEFLAILMLMGVMLAAVMLVSAAAREMFERSPVLGRNGSIILSIILLAAAALL